MTTEAPIAIVTDALWRKSVSAIRALGAAGYDVFALGDSILSTGLHSRYTTRSFRGPTAASNPAAFSGVLQQAVQAARGRPIALLPMEDATCEWLLQHGASLPGNVHWLLPAESSFAAARDKARTFEVAQQLGIPCPRTFAPASVEELASLIAAHPAEDFVIKPRTGSGSSGIVYGAAIRETPLDAHWRAHGPLLLQERIPAAGEARGVSLLFDRTSQPRAAFAHRRLRQYPVTGGPSTQRESIPLDELHEFSQRLLAALGWRGVAMVEWKIHPVTGRPLLLEINPRFWGSLALAVRAGVDFPTLYAAAALGRPLPATPPAYDAGVVCRWLLPGDILRYLSEPSGQRESLSRFLRGTFRDSEEFDGADWRGSLASALCPAMLALNPKYWRYLRRGRRTRS
jgi:predicted ATP-grasp superfamily ATP-dependent carboligase